MRTLFNEVYDINSKKDKKSILRIFKNLVDKG